MPADESALDAGAYVAVPLGCAAASNGLARCVVAWTAEETADGVEDEGLA